MNIRIKASEVEGNGLWLTQVTYLVASNQDPTSWLVDSMDEWQDYTITGEIFEGPDLIKRIEDLKAENEELRGRIDSFHVPFEDATRECTRLRNLCTNLRLESEHKSTLIAKTQKQLELAKTQKRSPRACRFCKVQGTGSCLKCGCTEARAWRNQKLERSKKWENKYSAGEHTWQKGRRTSRRIFASSK